MFACRLGSPGLVKTGSALCQKVPADLPTRTKYYKRKKKERIGDNV